MQRKGGLIRQVASHAMFKMIKFIIIVDRNSTWHVKSDCPNKTCLSVIVFGMLRAIVPIRHVYL